MKKLFLRVILAAGLAFGLAHPVTAQSTGATACVNTGAQQTATCPQLTDAIYWASQPQAIQDLQKLVDSNGIPDVASRIAVAAKLDAQGLVIDRQIHIWGWSPSLVMALRQEYGYVWVPNAFQPNTFILTDLLDGAKAWPRSIKVSTSVADYPPVAPPPPPVAVPDNVTWYFDAADGVYGVLASAVTNSQGAWIYTEGQPVSYKGTTVYFHLSYSIMGTFPQFWVKKP